MAEFERGYCTGCGYPAGRGGLLGWLLRGKHRPYCWRKVTMMLNVHAVYETKRKLLDEMQKHWRMRSFFLARKEHMYHQPGDLPAPREEKGNG